MSQDLDRMSEFTQQPIKLAKLTSALLREQEVRLPRGGKVGNPISGIEHGGSRLVRSLLEMLHIRSDRQGLVVAEATVVMKLDRPASRFVPALPRFVHAFVAYYGDLARLGADERLEQSADDGRHSRRQDDDGDAVGSGPMEELGEVGVELDVLAEQFDAFWKGRLDAVYHLLKRVSVLIRRSLRGIKWRCT